MSDQTVDLPRYSMFVKTPVYDTGDIVLGLRAQVVYPHDSDTLYTVPVGSDRRLDLISFELYGVPNLWWVIAEINNVTDPLSGIPSGTQIRVPTQQRLAAEGILSV